MAAAGEGSGSADILVTISHAPSESTTIQISPTFDSASFDDVGAIPTTVSWAAGDGTPKAVSIPIVDDDLDELDENLLLTITSPPGVAIGAFGTFTLTIIDNDVPMVSPAKVRFVGREGETVAINYEIDRAPASLSF
jgi:hypothetical protein